MVRNLTQLAPLLQRLASLELRLDDTTAAAAFITLQQLHSLRRLQLSSSNSGRELRLELVALCLPPSSLTELELDFVPALGDDPLANMFPTVCFPNLRRLVLDFGAVPMRVKQAEPFQATDALRPLLTWLKVFGPNPCVLDDSESDEGSDVPLKETLSAQFLACFPANKTLYIAEGHVEGFRGILKDMSHLLAACLHLVTYRLGGKDIKEGCRSIWLPALHNLQVLQLNLRDVDIY